MVDLTTLLWKHILVYSPPRLSMLTGLRLICQPIAVAHVLAVMCWLEYAGSKGGRSWYQGLLTPSSPSPASLDVYPVHGPPLPVVAVLPRVRRCCWMAPLLLPLLPLVSCVLPFTPRCMRSAHQRCFSSRSSHELGPSPSPPLLPIHVSMALSTPAAGAAAAPIGGA